MLPDFALVRATSIDEAIASIDEDHLPVCGGTELLLAMKMGVLFPAALVDISRLPDLHRVEVDGTELVIGGAVTHRRLSTDRLVREHVRVFADVEKAVGNARVRAQGSIAGNLCFAEPKSDVATMLIALGANVVLHGRDGSRRVGMESFVEGPYATVREDGELLTEVRIPLVPSRRARYVKFQTMERPTVGVAAVAGQDGVRVAVGAVGPMPVHADFGSVGSVDVDRLVSLADPLPDLTGSLPYKEHVTALYIRRALEGLS